MNEYDDDPPTPPRAPLTLEDSQSRRRTEQLARELLEEDMPPEQRRLAVRMRSHSRDPYDLMARMAAVVDRLEVKHDSGERDRNAAAETLLQLPKRVDAIEALWKGAKNRAWHAAIAIIVAVIGSAAAIRAAIEASGEAKGRLEEKLKNMQGQIDRLEKHEDDRRGYDFDIVPQPRHQKKDNEP